jgi:hypothetical protein
MPLDVVARGSALAPCVAKPEPLLNLSTLPMLAATFDETATLHWVAEKQLLSLPKYRPSRPRSFGAAAGGPACVAARTSVAPVAKAITEAGLKAVRVPGVCFGSRVDGALARTF